MDGYRLADLIELTNLQKLTNAHFRAAGMPIGIIDAIDGSLLVGAGWQDICLRFHRAHPASMQRCRESDDYIKGHLIEGEACSYKCKNGLWDIGIPILVAKQHLATLFLGQFFYEGEAPDRAFFARQAKEFAFDTEAYLEALDRVPSFSREKVDDILEYDKALAGFIANLAEHALLKLGAEQIIRESERKFRAIFDQAYQFLGILSVDGRVLEVNRSALEFCGAEGTDVLGQPFWETPWWAHSPELQTQVRDATERAAGGERVRFEVAHLDAHGRMRQIDFSLLPVKDEAGEVVLLIPEGRDITEHKLAEQETRRQAEFLQLIIDAMPYPVFYKDRQGRYIGCNRAFEDFFGTTREQIAGKTVFDISPRELAEEYDRWDKRLFAQPGAQTYEGRIQTPGETLHDVIFQKATFQGPDGETAGIVGAVLDITERKRTESEKEKLQAQLLQARKMESIGRLAGGVAHDFNNMLCVILNHAELGLRKLTPADPLHASLQNIEKAAERSALLTRQLLAFARKQTISPKVFDLNEIVSSLLMMLRRLVGEDIDLAWRPGEGLWRIRIDPAQADQILMNLAANARDAISGVGRISLETLNVVADEAYCASNMGVEPGEYVMLAVSDNGCGMDPETQATIFEPFFTTKESGKGTGLGLATVYGIVQQNLGSIHVYSEVGHGTTFKIYLPRCTEGLPEAGGAPVRPLQGGWETVLLVEDEAMLLDLARTLLANLGYAVLPAGNPEEALRLAEAHAGPIHLLLTDMVMPGMSGRDLAERLEATRPGLRHLFMSGYTAHAAPHQGGEEADMNFLQKPFSAHDLALKVREVLDRH